MNVDALKELGWSDELIAAVQRAAATLPESMVAVLPDVLSVAESSAEGWSNSIDLSRTPSSGDNALRLR
jgi:hypothetical protein